MIRFFVILVSLIFTQLGIINAQKAIRPFQTHNQSPVVHFFGLPTNTGGIVQDQNEFSVSNYFYIANNATSKKIGEEAIYLDGEMYRNEIHMRYGLFSFLEIGLQIPIVKHSSGVMDPIISSWHDAFNMPQKARSTMVKSALTYTYLENDEPVFNMGSSTTEIGDVSLSLGLKLVDVDKAHLSLNGYYKKSIGSKKQLIGSGTNDFAVQATGSFNAYSSLRQFSVFYSLGYLRVGGGALLEEKLTRNVIFGSCGVAYRLSKRFIPKAQFDFHSGFYRRSAVKQLGNESIQMVLGFDYHLNKKLSFSGALVEDLIVNTAPDFTLQFGISYNF